MKIIFKQAIDGLVFTSIVQNERGYISVEGRQQHPLVYNGLDIMALHLVSVAEATPIHFKANLLYYIKNLDRQAFVNAPTLTEDQFNRGYILQALKLRWEEHCKSVKKARKYDIKELELQLQQQMRRAPDGAESLIGNRRMKDWPIRKKFWEAVERIEAKIALLQVVPAWLELPQWEAYVEEIMPPAEAYWADKLAQLKAIPDGTYWLTEEPGSEDYVLINGEQFPCKMESCDPMWVYVNTGDAEYLVFRDRELAGQQARDYWADMAEHDKAEFTCMVGESNLIDWAFGKPAGPGSTKVKSLRDWLDLWLNTPEEQWAGYDGKEVPIELSPALAEDWGTFTVGYRTN